MNHALEPLHGRWFIPTAVKENHGRNPRPHNVIEKEGVFFVYRPFGLLPFALNNQGIGELVAVDNEEVALSHGLVNGVANGHLFGELLPAYEFAVCEELGFVIPKFSVATVQYLVLDKIFELVACSIGFLSATGSFG